MTAVLFRRLAIVLASASLISCLGGGGAGDDGGTSGGGNPFCESITGGNAKVSTGQSDGCFGCSADQPELAADGDLNTFASITAPETFAGQGVSLRATAQQGIIYPSGQQAAVIFIPPTTSGFASPEQAVTLATYLAGELQENPTALVSRSPEQTGTAYNVRMFTTTKAFDAVEVMVSNTQLATMPFEIHEICSNTSVQ